MFSQDFQHAHKVTNSHLGSSGNTTVSDLICVASSEFLEELKCSESNHEPTAPFGPGRRCASEASPLPVLALVGCTESAIGRVSLQEVVIKLLYATVI